MEVNKSERLIYHVNQKNYLTGEDKEGSILQ